MGGGLQDQGLLDIVIMVCFIFFMKYDMGVLQSFIFFHSSFHTNINRRYHTRVRTTQKLMEGQDKFLSKTHKTHFSKIEQTCYWHVVQ